MTYEPVGSTWRLHSDNSEWVVLENISYDRNECLCIKSGDFVHKTYSAGDIVNWFLDELEEDEIWIYLIPKSNSNTQNIRSEVNGVTDMSDSYKLCIDCKYCVQTGPEEYRCYRESRSPVTGEFTEPGTLCEYERRDYYPCTSQGIFFEPKKGE